MAYAKITLTNGTQLKVAPVGFSWTTFLFGFWPALIRGHYSWFAIIFFGSAFTYGLLGVVLAFFYNKIYIKHLLDSGYKIVQPLPVEVNDAQLKGYLSYVAIPYATEGEAK
jgi:hypothetical protein